MTMKIRGFIKPEILLYLSFILFSSFLMWKTFRVNSGGNMQIATKVWSDFSATIPLIRSFSLGSNIPPQYPLFAGPPIRYHFIFFALVGYLEKVGMRIDYALNILSSFSFTFLLTMIYLLGKEIFKDKKVGLFAVILFIFNGSFGFVEFFKTHPLSIETPNQILKNLTFSSFGPYDGKVVSAFWSMNIFTNQRHLAFAYASFLLLVYLIYKYSRDPDKFNLVKTLSLGIFIGIFPFIHLAVFGMMCIALLTMFMIYPKLRINILIIGLTALIIAIPQYLYMGSAQVKPDFFNPGYLVKPLTLDNFFRYWFFNLGLGLIILPIGLLISNRTQRKIFIPFLLMFLVGNSFQFSPEIAANHKFFNLFALGANFYISLVLVTLWGKKWLAKLFVVSAFIPLTLTGVIDIFPIINDPLIEIADVANNPTSSFIQKNTSKESVFLNANYLLDPASLAGRNTYLGWPYFAWSAGYDTTARDQKLRSFFTLKDKVSACKFLKAEKINFIEIQEPYGIDNMNVDYVFFDANFISVFINQKNKLKIFDVDKSCK